ncbi:putative Mg2+ transporter-C (MgtC) family protein [Raoultella sp. BIGb0138]|uniref:MgtC/SapB family protein n=1 Tax=Raoultella sp. BIGb0138 TaxID=2485115 RepID=UPI00104C1409|nr:MgtC/SapB family protein [Raoultella sp. BIGb0138]TCW15253.1 putative Mg2+ transporter-C (MgtC) family protein [Raoultella sp. BIGb0138]
MDSLLSLLDELGPLRLETIAKIVAAFVLGGVIGLERESKGKPVGFKTCVIIAVASCVLTVVSIQSAEYYAEISANIRSDPMRLAAQIISGVGFLGAGVILHRRDDAISGLTTAAIVWASAGVGIACGASFYFHALLATALFLLAIKISPYIVLLQLTHQQLGRVKVRLILNEKEGLPSLMARLNQQKNIIDAMTIRDIKKNKIEVNLKLTVRKRTTLHELYSMLSDIDHVSAVALEQ